MWMNQNVLYEKHWGINIHKSQLLNGVNYRGFHGFLTHRHISSVQNPWSSRYTGWFIGIPIMDCDHSHIYWIHSGKLTVCYGKLPIEIVDLPTKSGDFPSFFVCLPGRVVPHQQSTDRAFEHCSYGLVQGEANHKLVYNSINYIDLYSYISYILP